MEYVLVLVWWVTALALAAAALPLASLVCRRFTDRGAGLALPLALAVLGVVGFWVGQVAFGWPALLAGLAVLLGGMVVAMRRGAQPAWGRFAEVAAVFTAAFALLVVLRATDPGVYPLGGEKFLDHGLVATLLRSGSLPPEDMWFAGQAVEYYYGGHMLTALLARLTGTDAHFAYNVALATFFGAYVSAAYGLAGAVAAARDRSYRAAGLTAAVLVGLASNLVTPLRTAAWLLGEDLGGDLLSAAGVEPGWFARGPAAFWYWEVRGVLPGAIVEFPFFAFLNGDLHAHMMSPPLLLLVAGLLFSYHLTPAALVWRRRALLAAVAPLGGLVAVVNTWSLPTVVGLTWLALALASATPWSLLPARVVEPAASALGDDPTARARRLREEVGRPLVAAVVAGVVGLLAAVAAAPFLLGTTGGRSVSFDLVFTSGPAAILVAHGLFLAVGAAYLFDRLPPDRRGWQAALPGALVLVALAAWAGVQFWTAALVVPFVAVAWWLRRVEAVGYEAVLFAGAAGIVVLVEVAYLEGPGLSTRFNTVFKLSAQVWALFAVAGGVMLADLARFGTVASALRRRVSGTGPGPEARSAAVAVLGVAVLVSASLYAGFATANQVRGPGGEFAPGGLTLDARESLETREDGVKAAVAWLDDRDGQPAIVTATGSEYDWAGYPSVFTGLPTVVGWVAHEGDYQGRALAERRAADVADIYTESEERRASLLAEYDVRYLYVGPLERERYAQGTSGPGGGLPDYGTEAALEEVERFGEGTVVIYRVVD